MNWMIIIANSIVFLFELRLGPHAEAFISTYGLTPANTDLLGQNSETFITNMFLHGGWGHFLSNMWILFIFGDNVEDRMGRFRYLIFYILCGIMAGMTHYLLYRTSEIPAIGASGAISGVMAAYMFLYPRSTIISFVPLFFIPLLLPIPALIYIGIWFIGQFFVGTYHLMINRSVATGIAFWAHIGGFLGGLLIYWMFLKRKRN